MFDDPVTMRAWLDEALPVVYGFVFARCGADEQVAQDITQETMVEVVKHRGDFAGDSGPMTWVCAIARHKVADHFRATYRDQRRRLRLVDAAPPTSVSDENSAVMHAAVVDALRTLPEAQRVVLAFHYLDELPVRQIAARVGRSESAVESLLARARDGFKKAWNQKEELR